MVIKQAREIEGLKKIRCMWAPRYVYYDKPSKIRIFLDDGWSNGYCTNVSWEIRGYPENCIYPNCQPKDLCTETVDPQTGWRKMNYKTGMTMTQALAFAIKTIRDRHVSRYAPHPELKGWVRNIEKDDYKVPRKNRAKKN